jgi:hypothetical protein
MVGNSAYVLGALRIGAEFRQYCAKENGYQTPIVAPPGESIEHVFRALRTTKPGVLGMGLSLIQSIVENHSARLWAIGHESPCTRFCFALASHQARSGLDV